MKIALLTLFTLLLTSESFAQRRPGPGRVVGPRYNPPGSSYRPGPGSGPGPGRVVINNPRYTPNYGSRRVIRSSRMPYINWSSFGYSCSAYGDLILDGRRQVHNFRFSSDCYQALQDIRSYGDFCDNEDLYDRSGRLEAQFTFSSECRNALGWYY